MPENTKQPLAKFCCPITQYDELVTPGELPEEEGPELNLCSELTEREAERAHQLIHQSYIEPENVNVVPHEFEMEITLDTTKPFRAPASRLSYYEKAEVRKTLDRLLGAGIIRTSKSPYASVVVLVKKKTGEIRMCCDFRNLNQKTVNTWNMPLPLISDCMDYLAGKRWFSSLDLKGGFFHVKMAEESIPYIPFVVPHGQFEFLRMPFGLKCAPAAFQKSEIFQDLIDAGTIIIYMDDILVGSTTLEEHFTTLATVFRRVAEMGLELKLSRCSFFSRRIDCLGYTVNEEGVRPNDGHAKAILALPYPTDSEQVQRYLGLFSYFRNRQTTTHSLHRA